MFVVRRTHSNSARTHFCYHSAGTGPVLGVMCKSRQDPTLIIGPASAAGVGVGGGVAAIRSACEIRVHEIAALDVMVGRNGGCMSSQVKVLKEGDCDGLGG